MRLGCPQYDSSNPHVTGRHAPEEGNLVSVYTLPDLPYDYAALEPHISGKIMELHHDKHHAAYVAGANAALDKLAELREADAVAPVVNLHEKNLAFHLGGHTNHSVFWNNLSPEGGDKPEGELAAAIDDFFGSFDAFRAHFSANANAIQGSGWSILAWDSIGQRLIIVQLYDQQGNISIGLTPLLMLDMWEHAFYLDYQNVKGDYVNAFWNIVNWADVADRFAKARTQTAGLIVPA
ncbi:Fe-Mn family superoxide dismutase [Rhodococcus sp. LBL1]|uniref:Superoxide dismutase n=4 Tax=Prescottella TaxID=2979332 RepID=A0ABT6MD69_9NOCA|nr:Fe-Mn family superoxide dismutase [Prescottella agglutinans]MDH6680305.1 Fe-Mn family superoxide dismutase [Rhodococcus sp. LBL1]MDH6685734.1 Fe-Mn family superoxide dismutase [Rhodococcus sp. LBL2]